MDDYRLQTPEQVELSYTVAGLGTRSLALFIDTLIQGALLWLLFVSLHAAVGGGNIIEEGFLALFIVAEALVYYGYFFILELALKGSTPGKAAMGLRVVRIDGRGVDASGILLRNLLRIMDFLPGMYAVGVITMFAHKDSRRLGDLVAGTIVITQRKQVSLSKILSQEDGLVNTALKNQEYQMIRDFFARRQAMTKAARQNLADLIAAPLYDQWVATEEERQDPESFLDRVFHAQTMDQ